MSDPVRVPNRLTRERFFRGRARDVPETGLVGLTDYAIRPRRSGGYVDHRPQRSGDLQALQPPPGLRAGGSGGTPQRRSGCPARHDADRAGDRHHEVTAVCQQGCVTGFPAHHIPGTSLAHPTLSGAPARSSATRKPSKWLSAKGGIREGSLWGGLRKCLSWLREAVNREPAPRVGLTGSVALSEHERAALTVTILPIY